MAAVGIIAVGRKFDAGVLQRSSFTRHRSTSINSSIVYFGGDLFDHKHLIGNALLASYIELESSNAYSCLLPQDQEHTSNRRVSIRNQDLKAIIESDFGLFNFDGADLDSGTVVEFMVAKQLDIPVVILRTDIRNAGDQDSGGDNWNLMCSSYPRTEIVSVNGMELYQQASGNDIHQKITSIYKSLSLSVIQALDKVRDTPPLCDSAELTGNLYKWCAQYCGGGMEELLEDTSWFEAVLARKRSRGLIT